MNLRVAERVVDWDARYRVSPDVVIHFDEVTNQPLISRSLAIDCFDSKLRKCPERIVDLRYANPEIWEKQDLATYRISPEQLRCLIAFQEPATPRDALERLSSSARLSRSELAEFLVLAAILRFVIQHRSPAVTPRRPGAHRGVLIIGIGRPYIWMACALAESIKAGNPSLPIALVHGKNEARTVRKLEGSRGLFDTLIEVDRAQCELGGVFSPFFVKLCIDQLSPFDETLMIEADSLIFPGADLSAEIDRYDGCDFAPACAGAFAPTMKGVSINGIPLSDLARLFKLKKPMYVVLGYYLFFRKNESTSRLLSVARSLARKAHDSPSIRRYRGSVPDDPMLSSATSLVEVKVYSGVYSPIATNFFPFHYGSSNLEALRKRFLGLTTNTWPNSSYRAMYNAIVEESARIRGTRPTYFWDSA
jgi:hypothetical protein